VAGVIAEIDAASGRAAGGSSAANLSSALRVYVLEQARAGTLR
jgi:predicted DNA-binding ribbon-helix-helix protein